MLQRKQHWDDYWRKYRGNAVKRVTHDLTLRSAIKMMAARYKGRLPAELHLLDLGCGDGVLTEKLVSLLGLAGVRTRIVACDVSQNALRIARESAATRATFLLADARNLPFRDASFDGSVSFGYGSVASYHDGKIQTEIFRVVKPDGWLVADFRNHMSLWFLLLRPAWVVKWLKRRWGHTTKPQYHFSTLGVAAYFSRQGFDMESRRFLLSFPPSSGVPASVLRAIESVVNALHLNRLLGRIFVALLVRSDRTPQI